MWGWILAWAGLRAVRQFDREMEAQVRTQRAGVSVLKTSVRKLINDPATDLTPAERRELLRQLDA